MQGTTELGANTRVPLVDSALNFLLWRTFFPSTWAAIHRRELDDIVHQVSPDLPPLRSSRRCVITVHDNPTVSLESDLYSLSPQVRLIVRHNLKSYQRYDLTIVQSRYVEQGLSDFGYEGVVKVVPPATNPAFRPLGRNKRELRQILGLPAEKRLILSISTMAKRKNLVAAVQTLDYLPDSFRLVRIGPPIKQAINLPPADDERLNAVFNACDVLLMPSIEEGFGAPVAEAFAAGLPVVASDIPSIREVAQDSAALMDPKDPQGFAKLVSQAVSSPESWIERGFHRAKAFSINAVAPQLRAAYRVLPRL